MDLSPASFDVLREFIRQISGLALAEDKAYLVRQRLTEVVRAAGCGGFDEFCRRLRQLDSPALREQVIDAISTNETAFFRDGHPFEALKRQVLPALMENARRRQAAGLPGLIRIWCAGAATGQEPYSVGMTVLEALAASPGGGLGPENFTILATDISAAALAIARTGQYNERDLVRGLSPARIEQFFHRHGPGAAVREALRRLVEFRRCSLAQPFAALGRFDVIFCRNTLMYFDPDTRRSICDQFDAMLNDNGWLFLGAAENLYGISNRFVSVQLGATTVYRRA